MRRRRRLAQQVMPWRSPIWQTTSLVQPPTRCWPFELRPKPIAVTTLVARNASGSGHSFLTRFATLCSGRRRGTAFQSNAVTMDLDPMDERRFASGMVFLQYGGRAG